MNMNNSEKYIKYTMHAFVTKYNMHVFVDYYYYYINFHQGSMCMYLNCELIIVLPIMKLVSLNSTSQQQKIKCLDFS